MSDEVGQTIHNRFHNLKFIFPSILLTKYNIVREGAPAAFETTYWCFRFHTQESIVQNTIRFSLGSLLTRPDFADKPPNFSGVYIYNRFTYMNSLQLGGVISEYWEQYNFVGTFNIFQGVGDPVPQHRHGRERGADHARGGPLPQVHHGRHLGGQHREDLRRARRLGRQGRGLPRIQSILYPEFFISLSLIQRPSMVLECKLFIASKVSVTAQNNKS